MSRALDARDDDEQLAIDQRRLSELTWQQDHLLSHGDTAGALELVGELDRLRHQVRIHSTAKFNRRATGKTITFERDPVRLVEAVKRLDQQVKTAHHKKSWAWYVSLVASKWMQALDDLVTVGRRKSDRKSDLNSFRRNTGTRIH